MAVVLVDGFDLYNGTGTNTGLQAKWSISSTSNTTMQTGRFGGQCVQWSTFNGDRNGIASFSATASVSAGFALRQSVAASSTPNALFWFLSSGTYQFGLTVDINGAVSVKRMTSISAGTTLGTSANNVIFVGQWHYIEVELTISDTTGTVNVYVDGASVISLTNQDTRNGTPTTVNQVAVGASAATTAAGTWQFDDLYVNDTATKLGQRKVETIYPTSDVAQGFARSSGSTNYTLVDEAQVNGDTDYVQGSTVGDVDTYGLGDLSNTPTTIDAVQVSAFALKTDAGSRSIALQVKSGATTSDGSNYALNSTYAKFDRLLLTDPNTSSAWTGSGVNALQGGPKVTV